VLPTNSGSFPLNVQYFIISSEESEEWRFLKKKKTKLKPAACFDLQNEEQKGKGRCTETCIPTDGGG